MSDEPFMRGDTPMAEVRKVRAATVAAMEAAVAG